MSEVIAARAPSWFRIVAVLALLWNLIGITTYLMHVGLFGDPGAGATEAQRALAASVPDWVTAAYAVGVFAGLGGAIGLITLKAWSKPLFLLSLVAVLLQSGWILFVSDAASIEGAVAVAVPIAIILIALLLFWLSDLGSKRGWLR